MENQVMEYEKKQIEITKKSHDMLSHLENSYRDAEGLIYDINIKRRKLASARKKLGIATLIMAILVAVSFALKLWV